MGSASAAAITSTSRRSDSSPPPCSFITASVTAHHRAQSDPPRTASVAASWRSWRYSVLRSVATTCPDGPTCSASQTAIEPRPAPTSRHPPAGPNQCAPPARRGVEELLEQAQPLILVGLSADGGKSIVRHVIAPRTLQHQNGYCLTFDLSIATQLSPARPCGVSGILFKLR